MKFLVYSFCLQFTDHIIMSRCVLLSPDPFCGAIGAWA